MQELAIIRIYAKSEVIFTRFNNTQKNSAVGDGRHAA